MAGLGHLTEKARRARREKGENWTAEDEREWLQHFPDDEPLPGYEQALDQPPPHDADLVPEIDEYEQSEEDDQIDQLLARVGIVEAYNRWANKGQVDAGRKTESIKVRCPDPSHPDHDPSAWLNTEKNLWVCAGCGLEGGDKYDIAAWHFGFSVPGYKEGSRFPELRKQMAIDLGYTVITRAGKEYIEEAEPEPESSAAPAADGSASDVASVSSAPATSDVSPAPSDEGQEQPTASVTTLFPDPYEQATAETQEIREKLYIDWRSLLTNEGFMRAYMETTSKDDLPEEYHFWNGLIALGLAVGNDIYLDDYSPVRPNLFATIIGTTGSGKSRSLSHLAKVLSEALPYDPADPANTGTFIIRGAGSGEALIDCFVETHQDDIDPYTVPVRGLMEFNELSNLVGKSSNTGSVLKPVLMQFYDCEKEISAVSRTHGNSKAHNAFGSCVTTTQPQSLRRLVNYEDADSGFLNRWVFVWGAPKKKVSYGGATINMDEPAKYLRAVKSWAAQRRGSAPMTLSGEALDIWDEFFHEYIEANLENKEDLEDEDALLARTSLLFKKLIVLLAIDRRESMPSATTVRDAISLWEYVKSSYRMVGISLSRSEMRDIEEGIISLCKKYTSTNRLGPTRKQITDSLKHRHAREDIKKCIGILENLGVIEERSFKKKGQTSGPGKTVLVLGEDGS